ncbi:hypothetical protein K1719_008830 [Acacia pycnantha]|nr:hypothetical protein K1719_008830 [Acacia pycnantha]
MIQVVAFVYFPCAIDVVVLDSLGHKDFVPNMISGATQADAAILVIDASLDAYEAAIRSVPPDDVVSTGLQSSKKGLKGTVANSRSSDVSSQDLLQE